LESHQRVSCDFSRNVHLHKEQVQHATEEENNRDEGKQEKVVAAKICQVKRTQEVDRLRQQRHRQNKYDKEISLGEQSLGGTKQNLKVFTAGIQSDLKNILITSFQQ
jgi:hypothetical protein